MSRNSSVTPVGSTGIYYGRRDSNTDNTNTNTPVNTDNDYRVHHHEMIDNSHRGEIVNKHNHHHKFGYDDCDYELQDSDYDMYSNENDGDYTTSNTTTTFGGKRKSSGNIAVKILTGGLVGSGGNTVVKILTGGLFG
ncbi:MAG: hypothetical protein WCY19_08450 [Candidatus Gastranaerophilaceae bacterium]